MAFEVLYKLMLLLTWQIWTNILIITVILLGLFAHHNQMTLTLPQSREFPSKTQKTISMDIIVPNWNKFGPVCTRISIVHCVNIYIFF